jgi:hypothetical protein
MGNHSLLPGLSIPKMENICNAIDYNTKLLSRTQKPENNPVGKRLERVLHPMLQQRFWRLKANCTVAQKGYSSLFFFPAAL